MGTAQSKKPLAEWTPQDIATQVELCGTNYQAYGETIVAEGVCGLILTDAKELQETLDDLKVESKLHRRVLSKKWAAFSGLSLDPPVVPKAASRKRPLKGGASPKRAPKPLNPMRSNKKGMSEETLKELAEDIEGPGGGMTNVTVQVQHFCNQQMILSDHKRSLYGPPHSEAGRQDPVRRKMDNKIRYWAKIYKTNPLDYKAILVHLKVTPHSITHHTFMSVGGGDDEEGRAVI